jgi:ABC-type antimicrobial peptide transport system permease subunit
MSALLTPTTAAAVLFGMAVLIAVIAAVLPRCPARRRDALRVLEILVRRRLRP